MKALKVRFECLLTLFAVLVLAGSAQAVEDQYGVVIDEAGHLAYGEGSGYNDGEWYYYPNTGWYNQWFYNSPFDPDRKKVIQVSMTVKRWHAMRPASAKIAYNWSTDLVPPGHGRPPLPIDVPSPDHEELLIGRHTFFEEDFSGVGSDTISISEEFEISDYNPEWVSIDVRGENFMILDGVIVHECVPKEGESKATNPSPADGATDVPTDVVLTWTAGENATWHHVYFGTDRDAVANANPGSPEYKGQQPLDANSYEPISLEFCTNYFWRTDELECLGPMCESILVHKGNVWDFTTTCLQPPTEPFLRVGDWLNPEPWHNWISAHEETHVQLHVFDPCELIHRVNFYYSINDGPWELFYTDVDGFEAPEDTNGAPNPDPGDGWSGYLLPGEIPTEVCELVSFRAEAFYGLESFLDVFKEVKYDPTPPDSVSLNVEDWQFVEDDILTVDVDPILADIAYAVAWVEPKPEEYNKGIPKVKQKKDGRKDGGKYHCAPTAAAACLKYFEKKGDPNICGGLSADDLVDELAKRAKTNQGGKGTSPSDLANALRRWIGEKSGRKYTVRGPLRRSEWTWEWLRGQFERSQDVLLGIHWPKCTRHRMTLNSIVNRPLPNGKIKIDFMDPWTGEYQYGELDPSSGKLDKFDSTSGNRGTLERPIIICPPEKDPNGGAPDDAPKKPGPDPDPRDIPIPCTHNLYTLHVIVVDWCNNAARLTRIVTKKLDFGDAPDPTYPTLQASDGARHVIVPGMFLGNSVDPEANGQPDAAAAGDDNDGNDDEDGVFFTSPLIPGQQAWVDVTPSVGGLLDAWIDFNGDGSWAQAGDEVFGSVPLTGGGVNGLSFLVPATATPNISTYARFRFSKGGGLSYRGLAPDGEVEDYLVRIGPRPAKPPVKHVKWSQPPIEIEPDPCNIEPPVYSGWDEQSWIQQPDGVIPLCPPQVADDFRCLGTMPITSIHWWGSHFEWERLGIVPPVLPTGWRIGFWSNVPAKPAGDPNNYSQPGELLWQVEADANDVEVEEVGSDAYHGYHPNDVCYQYTLYLEPNEYFWQGDFNDVTEDSVFWLSIQAIYAKGVDVVYPWGWKTRPWHWMDDAVRREWRMVDYDPPAGPGEHPIPILTCVWEPIEDPLYGESFDVAFELDTDPNYIKWEQPYTGIRQWAHYEDEKSMATEEPDGTVAVLRCVADDWKCERQTPVTAAVWWGSYLGYYFKPCHGPFMELPKPPDYFRLSIWTNVPATADNPFSHPGEMIWEYQAYDYDEVLVGYDKHPHGEASESVFRYSVRLPEDKWFCQRDANGVYWFSVMAVYKHPSAATYPWGWTNHQCQGWEPPGLTEVAHLKFDETSGGMASDSSSNNNHGTLVGDPTWQACCGTVCGALDFDGDGDYVKTADTTTGLDFAPNSFSVSVWINAREVTDGWRTVLEYDRDGSDDNRFGLWLSNQGKFHFRVGRDTKNSDQTLDPDKWYSLTATFDSTSKQMSLYINGNFDSSKTHAMGFNSAKAMKLTIGVRGWEDDEYFNGLIDDVRVFNHVLSEEEVKALAAMKRNDDAVAGHVDTAGTHHAWKWEELRDQTEMSEDMSFILFTDCFPCTYTTYPDWVALGRPYCWCWPYQCDGDADGRTQGFQKYRVMTNDLAILIANWTKQDSGLAGDCPRPQ